MFILYDLLTWIFVLIYFPVYLIRRRFYRGFGARLGFLPYDPGLKAPIWVHAVSVGEAMAVSELVAGLRRIDPLRQFVVSTVTPTGHKVAKRLCEEEDFITYLPLDIRFVVKAVIDQINPSIFIIAETEIWPNLISYLHKRRIPIVVVNGRISDRSLRGYLLIRFLVKSVLNKINRFCVQTNRDAERLKLLGVDTQKIRVTGNMKFDIEIEPAKASAPDLKLGKEEKLLVCASSHSGEEEIILGVYKELLPYFPHLRLLIAPRHPERGKQVGRMIGRAELLYVFISALPKELPKPGTQDNPPVFILDTVGQLISLYHLADIVVVGGSFIKKGGHNILEPASLAKPIIFGPHMFNFRDISELFLANQAAMLAAHPGELRNKIIELLNNPTLAQQMGQRAKELVQKSAGATKRNLELIKEFLPKS